MPQLRVAWFSRPQLWPDGHRGGCLGAARARRRAAVTLAGADSPRSATVVHLDGDIDVSNANDIAERLCDVIDRGQEMVVVECSAVRFVESRGLAMMARVQRSADDAGCRLTWRALPLSVLRTLHVSGLDTYLRIEA